MVLKTQAKGKSGIQILIQNLLALMSVYALSRFASVFHPILTSVLILSEWALQCFVFHYMLIFRFLVDQYINAFAVFQVE